MKKMKITITCVILVVCSFLCGADDFTYFENKIGDNYLDSYLSEPYTYKRIVSKSPGELQITFDFLPEMKKGSNGSFCMMCIVISNRKTLFDKKLLSLKKELSEQCVQLIKKAKGSSKAMSTDFEAIKRLVAFQEVKGVGAKAYRHGLVTWNGAQVYLIFSTLDHKYEITVSFGNLVNKGATVPNLDIMKVGKELSKMYNRYCKYKEHNDSVKSHPVLPHEN